MIPRFRLIVLIVMAHFFGFKARELFHIVNSTLTSADGKNQTRTYFLINNVAREIKDIETVAGLNFDPTQLVTVDHNVLVKLYSIGDEIPPIKYTDKSPDDSIRLFVLRSTVFNGNLMKNHEIIGNYANPSIVKYRGRLLLVASLQFGFTGSQRKKHTNYVEFRWLNHTKYPFYTEGAYLGVENEVEGLNEIVYGQDPRVLVYNDSYFQIFFTSLSQRAVQRMGVAEAQYLYDENRINITYINQPISPEHLDHKGSQKNWSPFLYKGELHMVALINPMVVVRLEGYGSSRIQTSIVSFSNHSFESYLPGDLSLRGGTNAIRLNDDDGYLAFFHSRTRLPWNSMTTYVFGAYTFSADPPFNLLKVSPTPIMPEQLHNGAWASRFIDYCLFPMHIFLEEGTIHMSLGFQDQLGVIAEIDLVDLLRTLVPINASLPDALFRWGDVTVGESRHHHHRRGNSTHDSRLRGGRDPQHGARHHENEGP